MSRDLNCVEHLWRSWDMLSGEGTLQTWDDRSSLLTSSVPENTLTGTKVSEIVWLQQLPWKSVQQNNKLRVPSFLSRFLFSLCFKNDFVEPQFKINFYWLIFSAFITFVSFGLFQWPLWDFLSLTEGSPKKPWRCVTAWDVANWLQVHNSVKYDFLWSGSV